MGDWVEDACGFVLFWRGREGEMEKWSWGQVFRGLRDLSADPEARCWSPDWSQRQAGVDEATHLSADAWRRAGKGAVGGKGRSPATYRSLRLGPLPNCPGPASPICDVSASGPLNGRPGLLAGS